MVVRKRSLNTKRHTTGYLIGNQWRTRSEAVELAEEGRVDGVRVGRKGRVKFLTRVTGCPRLYDLPTVVRE